VLPRSFDSTTKARDRKKGITGDDRSQRLIPDPQADRAEQAVAVVGRAGHRERPSLTRLEDQALVPMFGTHPMELGLSRDQAGLLARLRAEPQYQARFAQAFGVDGAPFSSTT